MKRPLFWLLIATVACAPVHAQSWTVLLGHDQCSAIAFADDTILLGTNAGLFRYHAPSGFLAHDKLAFDSVPSYDIRSIFIDTDGSRWICTGGYGLIHLTAAGCQRYLYDYAMNVGNSVSAIVKDGAGHYWAGTNYGLYYSVDGTQWTSRNDGLPSTNINDLCIDIKGNLCAATFGGLAVQTGGAWAVTNRDNSPLPDDYVKTVMVDSAGRIWIISGGSVAVYDNSQWTIYRGGHGDFGLLNPECLAEDRDGAVWVGSYNYGVGRFNDGRWSIYDTANSNLTHNTVLSLRRDNAGTLWAGTHNGYLVQLDGPKGVYHVGNGTPVTGGVISAFRASNGDLWCSNYAVLRLSGAGWDEYTCQNSGLPENGGSGFCEDAGGKIWLICSRSLVCYNGSTFRTFDSSTTDLPNDWFNCMVYDRKSNVSWIGTEDSGLIRFDGAACTKFDSTASPALSRIHALALDSGGGLWVASLYGGFANFKNNAWTYFTNRDFGLYDQQVNCLMVDKANRLWVGTRKGLLTLADRTHWQVFDSAHSGIPDDYVISLTQGSDGALWVGTHGGGLAKFKDNIWTTYHYGNSPLMGNDVTFLTSDRDGNIIMGFFSSGMAVYGSFTLSARRPEAPRNVLPAQATVFRARARWTLTIPKSRGAISPPAKIFTPAGRLVKTLFPARHEGVYCWDYREECGRRVPPGLYVALVPDYGTVKIALDR
jgi:ligand-binding sensor domain-containing protein